MPISNYTSNLQREYSSNERRDNRFGRREFPIYTLNDTYKNLNQRAGLISEWGHRGGVLMMGYELYRQLANKKPRKKKSKVDDDKADRKLLAEVRSFLVNPGPDLVICDEGHRIKNSHASISQVSS